MEVPKILTSLFDIKQLLNIQSYVASQTLAQKIIADANILKMFNDRLFKLEFII